MAQARTNAKTTTAGEEGKAIMPEQPQPASADPEHIDEATTPDVIDYAAIAAEAARAARAAMTKPRTEDVILLREAGGHKAGDTITITHGAADYLREQGYVGTDDED